MNFSKLKFYDVDSFGKKNAVIFFPNTYGASVSQGASEDEYTYEVLVLVALKPHAKGKIGVDSKITYNTPITDDVLYLTREEVEIALDEIAALPPRRFNEPAHPYTGDFNDEEAVLGVIATAIDVDLERATIHEDRGLQSFGTGTVYAVELGNRSWTVVENEDEERELALAIVRQDLEENPENFNQNFIESQIDTEALRGALHSDAYDSNHNMVSDEAGSHSDDFWQRYEGEGLEAPEEDEEGNRREPTSREIDELAESLTETELQDPMEYLENIYGKADAAAQALKMVGFDVDEAAEEAVSADGAAHYLSTYDGRTHVTSHGLVWWRSS